MTLIQIAQLTLEDSYRELLERLMDFSTVPSSESRVTIDPDDTLSFYDRILVHTNLTKPTEQALVDELIVYKQELTDAENARLSEVARIKDLKDRFKVLKNKDAGVPAFGKLHPNISNVDAYFRDSILNEANKVVAENLLKTIEDEDASHLQERDKEKRREIRRKNGEREKVCCDEIFYVIKGWNDENNLSVAEIEAMESTFAEILTALRMSKRPRKVRTLITAVDPSLIPNVDQEMKDDILDILTKHGF